MKLKQILFALLFPLALCANFGATELRIGYFYPESSVIREIYGGGVEGEIETSAHLYRGLDLFANAGIFSKSGSSMGLGTRTQVKIFPLCLGLKYNFCLSSIWAFYLGAAPTYTWAHFHDHSPFVVRHVHKSAFGVVGKLGIIYTFLEVGFIDLFFDYYYTKISGVHAPGIVSVGCDIGGFRTGLGLGVKY